MDPAAPTGGTRRGRRRRARWLAAIAAIPLAAFGLSNLWLASPWGRGLTASIIKRRTGLESTLLSASWSPWNGVTLRGLACQQPAELRAHFTDPLLAVDRIRVAPVWNAWLRGRISIHHVEIDAPQLTLPVELLAHLATSQSPPKPAAPPPTPPPPTQPPDPPATTPAEPPAAPPPPPPPPVVSPAPPSRPTTWVHLTRAALKIVAVGRTDPLLATTLTAAIPIAGDPAQGHLLIHRISALGTEILPQTTAPLTWKSPLLSAGPIETEILGTQLQFALHLARTSGFPIQIDAAIPPQKSPEITLPQGYFAVAESLAAQARFRGLLLAPSSWQGDLIAESSAVEIATADATTTFDRGRILTVLRGNVLQCLDARLIGDDLSILANAAVISDGRAAAAIRFVAQPATLVHLAQRLQSDLNPPLTPLSTPQRAALDLRAFGTLDNLTLEIGPNGPRIGLPNLFIPPTP